MIDVELTINSSDNIDDDNSIILSQNDNDLITADVNKINKYVIYMLDE